MVTTSASGVPGPRAGVGAAKDHAIVRTQGTIQSQAVLSQCQPRHNQNEVKA